MNVHHIQKDIVNHTKDIDVDNILCPNGGIGRHDRFRIYYRKV